MAFVHNLAVFENKILYFLLLVSCTSSLGIVTTEAFQNSSTGEGAGWQQFLQKLQLPEFAKPLHYDLRLKPNMENFIFSGSVRVSLNITSLTEYLVFNAYMLEIPDNVIQYDTSNEVLKPVKVWKSEVDQIVILEFSKKLPVGTGNLTIATFSGNITEDKLGLYRSPYDANGKNDYMAVTQFESVYARRCFPCWDEPDLKATFKVTLDVQSNLTALSNMPIVNEELHDNWKTVSYEVSPIMPTYTVAIVVGMFDYIEDFTSNGIKVRVYGPIGKADQGKFSLDVAVRSIDIFERYLAVRYPLPKLDMIGVPLFENGAMENFGLITYLSSVFYVTNDTTIDQKRDIALVVAHEVAHQWFSNLVTMKWWKYLWLNEGFAQWFNYYAVDQIFPEWEIWSYFIEKDGAIALVADADSKTIPIELEVNNLQDVDKAMSSPAIIYLKAAYIIQMLHTYLGPETFQHSMGSYIKEFSWSSVDSDNLWAALEKASGKPVKNVMSQWVKQIGYPVVSVEISANNLMLKQSSILSDPSHKSDVWTVPLTLCCGSYENCYSILLNQSSAVIELSSFKGCSCGTNRVLDPVNLGGINNGIDKGCPWIKVNANQTGYFRVMYESNLGSRLATAIKQKSLSHADRFGILSDLNALDVSYKPQLHYLFTLMDAYMEEDNSRVLAALISASNTVTRIIADAAPEKLSLVKTFFIKLLTKNFGRYGWDSKPNEEQVVQSLRLDFIKTLAILGDEATIAEATKRFHAFLADNNTSPHPNIKELIFIAVMQKANKSNAANYESLLRMYNTSDFDEKQQILNALFSCPDSQILREALDLLFSPKVYMPQIYYALDYVSWQGRETAWSWLVEHWANVSKNFPDTLSFIVPKIVSPLLQISSEKVNEVKTFFANQTLPSFAVHLESSLLQIEQKLNWVQKIKGEKGLADFIDKLTAA